MATATASRLASLSVPFIVAVSSINANISDALPLITDTFADFNNNLQNCFRYVEAPTATGSNTIGKPASFAV